MKRFLGTLRLCLLVLCIFAPAVAHALPSGYTRLEYVESTDTAAKAYIDTGLTYNSGYLYDITFSKGGLNNSIMGVRLSSTYSAKGNFSVTYANNNTAVYSSTSSASTAAIFGDTTFGVKHNIQYQQSTRKLMFDGRSYWKSEWITSLDIPYNVYLFAFNIAGSPSGSRTNYSRIYSYKVRNANGVLIQNFVPVKNSSGVVGFYDLSDSNPVTAFHKNKGSGSFIAGPEVGIKIATKAYNDSEFESVQTALSNARTTVSSVVSNTISQSSSIGTLSTSKQNRPTTDCPDYRQCMLVQDANNQPQWFPIVDPFYDLFKPIITQGYSINVHNTSYDLGYTQVGFLNFTSGAATNINTMINLTNSHKIKIKVNGNNFSGVMGRYVSQSSGFQLYNGSFRFGAARLTNSLASYYNQDVILTYGQDGLFVNGTLIARPSTQTFTLGSPCLIGSVGSGDSTFAGKIYEAWIENGSGVVGHYLPVMRNDGIYGMYDTVGKAFLQNMGTGSFTAGGTPVINTDIPTQPTWTVEIPENETLHIMGGTVYGTAKCNSLSATANDVATSANLQSSSWTTAGNNCWCSIKSVDANGNAGIHENSAWVFVENNGNCTSLCSQICATTFAGDTTGAFRGALSGIR